MNCVEALAKTEAQFVAYADYCLSVFKYFTPIRTGQLRDSEVKDRIDDKTFVIKATATNRKTGFYYPQAVNYGRKAIDKDPGWLEWTDPKYGHIKTHHVDAAEARHFLEKTIAALKGGA